MSQVLATEKSLTGKWRIKDTLFGPRIQVEYRCWRWDTNSGYDDGPDWKQWANAKFEQTLSLKAKDKVI